MAWLTCRDCQRMGGPRGNQKPAESGLNYRLSEWLLFKAAEFWSDLLSISQLTDTASKCGHLVILTPICSKQEPRAEASAALPAGWTLPRRGMRPLVSGVSRTDYPHSSLLSRLLLLSRFAQTCNFYSHVNKYVAVQAICLRMIVPVS